MDGNRLNPKLISYSKLRTLVKSMIAHSGLKPFRRTEMFTGLVDLGNWLRQNDCARQPYFDDRSDLYRHLNTSVINNGPIDYLEFGVFRGESMRSWTRINTHPESRFFGFDTFTGLPEQWQVYTRVMPAGTFDVQGQMPSIPDPRVRLIQGLFQDTMPGFLETFRPNGRLVLNLDADLYSSTLFVLAQLHPYLSAGTVLIFDEFSAIAEFRALIDYAGAFRRQYRFLGASERFYDQVAVELTDGLGSRPAGSALRSTVLATVE